MRLSAHVRSQKSAHLAHVRSQRMPLNKYRPAKWDPATRKTAVALVDWVTLDSVAGGGGSDGLRRGVPQKQCYFEDTCSKEETQNRVHTVFSENPRSQCSGFES